MKVIFADASELQIQKAYIDAAGALRIKTISATHDQIREIFSDSDRTKRITVTEREKTLAEYEGYTTFDGIMAYTAGILESVLYKAGETPQEKIERMESENAELQEQVDMLRECILEMSEQVYQ